MTKTWTAMLFADMVASGAVRYSNLGMAVLGHALAERAGTPYDRLVTDRVLRPAGMTGTVFRPDGGAPPPAAATGRTAAPSAPSSSPPRRSNWYPSPLGKWIVDGNCRHGDNFRPHPGGRAVAPTATGLD